MASAFRDIGREERSILQDLMDDVHGQFIQAVAEGRKMPAEEIKKLADGRIFSGRQAKQLGLVDDLGDLEYAISEAAKMVGIKGEPEVVTKKERLSIMEMLSGKFSATILQHLPKAELKYMFYPLEPE
jgi:protease-4